MKKLYLSEEGLKKLQDEVAACHKEKMNVAARIEAARELGDLKENGDYHAAKEEQALLHARISDLENKIARAEVVDHSQLDHTKALLGAKVRVMNKKTNKEMLFELVSPVEADVGTGKISVRSPVGESLLGKEVGEVAVAKVPNGDLELEVLEISR